MHTCTFAHSKDSPAGATLHDEMLLLFEKERESSPHLFPRYDAPVEKNSGRIERRSCWQTGHVGWFEDIGEWPGLRSVIMVEAGNSCNVQVCKRPAINGQHQLQSRDQLILVLTAGK